MRHPRCTATTTPHPAPARGACQLALAGGLPPHRAPARRPALAAGALTLLLLASAAGCSDPEQRYFLLDASRLLDGQVIFLGLCQADSDCASGRCLELAGSKRCSRTCSNSASCPRLTGWTCSDGFCSCTTDAAAEISCTTDNNCDGVPDKTAAAESCNGEDDDCNGIVDDVAPGTVGAQLYYRDADGDGYGDPYTTRWACAPEAGWILESGDCDDGDAEVHPGQTEICGDNKDNNCDGYTDSSDVCGRLPVQVSDVDGSEMSGTLTTCTAGNVSPSTLDITEIVAKQDSTRIKYTVRVAGHPGEATCSSYVLHLGDPGESPRLAYVFRPVSDLSCSASPSLAAFVAGVAVDTAAVASFLANAPGHVAFIIPKSEIFPELGQPTYQLKACSNAVSDLQTDRSECRDDSCETAVRRN